MVYAFHFPHLLNPQIESSTHRTLYRQHILGIVLRGPALCFAAAGFSLFFYPLVSGGSRGVGRGDISLSRWPPEGGAGEAPLGRGTELCKSLQGHRAARGLVPRVSGNIAGGQGPPPAPPCCGDLLCR